MDMKYYLPNALMLAQPKLYHPSNNNKVNVGARKKTVKIVNILYFKFTANKYVLHMYRIVLHFRKKFTGYQTNEMEIQ